MTKYYTRLLSGSCKGLFALLMLTLLTACNMDKKDPILGVDPIEGLTSIVVSPQNSSIAAGLSQQFTALGVYADGTSLDISNKVSWSSTTATVATMNHQGLALSIHSGTTVITAAFAGKTASSLLTVTDAELIGFSISPLDTSIAAGLSQQFTAMGVYTDGSTANISRVVAWQSSNPAIAVIAANQTDHSGLATAVAPGNTEISASMGALFASTNFMVTDAALIAIQLTPQNKSLFVGLSQRYTATGVYTDGTSQNISALVNWTSSATDIATVDNTASPSRGIVSAISAGSSLISASLAAITAETSLTVSAITLSSVLVTPANSSVAAGLSRQYVATANYADGSAFDVSHVAIWASSDTSVAIMTPNGNDNSGIVNAQQAGSAEISASFSQMSGTANLNVTAATLTSILITPTNSSIIAGQSRQYTATGVYSDGSSENLTAQVNWVSSDNMIAVPNTNMTSNSGLVTAVSAGTAQIQASLGTINAQTNLTVTSAILSTISVTPVSSSVAVGLSRQFTATGLYSDGSTLNITQSVTWASSNTQVATLNANSNNNSGLTTGQAAGEAQISASLSGKTAAATLTVTNASLNSINVTPQNPSIVAGLNRQFSATGNYSDGTSADLTPIVNWTSGNVSVASMNASQQTNSGLATALSEGMSLIKASLAGIEGSSTLTVNAASLVSINVTPANASVRVNQNRSFTATGTYSDGSTQTISSSVVWTSSNTNVAVLNSNHQTNSGIATALAAGLTDITATVGTIQDNAVLTVTAALANNPQAPEMGELDRFVMIASQAITTTVGSTISNGDMAILDLARTAYAGFTQGPVAGQFTQLSNGVSFAPDDTTPPYVVPVPYASMVAFINQVRTDLGIAATFLAANPNPAAATQALPSELGSLVLTRGVYRNAGNVIIQQGNVTLDAQGDPDSVFIFVIGGTLSTGAPGGSIELIGGAQANNVYWRTGGSTVLGSNTQFAGNVFAWPQINLGTGAEVTGRLFSVTEQVTLDANSVTKAQ
ncbi:hypothetical protein GCM10010919_08670 [Alishewanella longhuensis]|uniref:BIG2 domain-containing protein n=1 Tax=Alishewanella longhuensis TaxID=1091037 RepID=A0ABQ3L3U6_9ALTE|nr:Ig-like domain-containing protein [Alishewanella longhuensis]GHG63198.1 hypothetical protein GCM10010919_08670 [Alishewanella longhuensis]